MLRILTVIGTRPEVIKMAPVIEALAQVGGRVESRLCVTAQHREMLDRALRRVGLGADHDLDVMTAGQTPTDVAAAVMRGLDTVLAAERPDWVLVQGDTTTTAAAALAAAYAGINVAHVEAGLRTGDPTQPFPEELNRCLVSRIASRHFAPTPLAQRNLRREGVPPEQILVTGNTGIDALYATVAELDPATDRAPFELPPDSRLVLATAHRRENLGEPLVEICEALREIVALADDIHVVYPLHPRPDVSGVVRALLGDEPRIVLCDPLDHPALVRMMLRSRLVVTDSGGLQEEAPSLGRPVLVMRELTERPEAIDAGVARLVGTSRERIVGAAKDYLNEGRADDHRNRPPQCYGDGRAAERIVSSLLGEFVEEWNSQPATLADGRTATTRTVGSRPEERAS